MVSFVSKADDSSPLSGIKDTPRGCTHCGGVVVADELHMTHECPVVQPFRLQYAALFTPDTNTMRSFFAQQDHMQVFKFVLDCLDFLKH